MGPNQIQIRTHHLRWQCMMIIRDPFPHVPLWLPNPNTIQAASPPPSLSFWITLYKKNFSFWIKLALLLFWTLRHSTTEVILFSLLLTIYIPHETNVVRNGMTTYKGLLDLTVILLCVYICVDFYDQILMTNFLVV